MGSLQLSNGFIEFMRRSTILKLGAAIGFAGLVVMGGLTALLFASGRLDGISAEISNLIIDRINLGSFATSGSLGAAQSVDGRDFHITVDASRDVHPISPLIYGVSAASQEWLEATGATINNWGGNPSSRYNWQLGNAWNAARDWQYRNGNYGHYEPQDNVADTFVRDALEVGADVRISIPTLGWVAKDDANDTCSFPLENGECGDGYGATCDNPVVLADPELANIESDVEFVRGWMRHLRETHGADNIRIIGMDNEPELWGYTHYDVHPTCTTYQEILDKYINYAAMVREELPDAELAGPVTCCWYYFWNSAAGRRDKWANGNQQFVPWFLERMREYDEATGVRHLDILDLHYYPASGIFNQDVSDRVSATRLRSTGSLWDKGYRDESWIRKPVYLIPRMLELIEEHYPGTKFGLSEWNFGAEESMNGALAIADALGIFGREKLYFATYWTHPKMDTPGYFAFKLFGNYDDKGGSFGDTSVHAETDNHERVSSFASIDSKTGYLHIVLINKLPTTVVNSTLAIEQYAGQPTAVMYRYSAEDVTAIQELPVTGNDGTYELALAPYSINHLVVRPQR